MLLVDTSAIIEWLVGSETGREIEPRLPASGEWLTPTIVQLELSKWMLRELEEEKADQVLAFLQTCVIAPLDTAIALSAARFCGSHKLATADAVIYATAQAHGADLLTCDAHFERLPGAIFVAKRG